MIVTCGHCKHWKEFRYNVTRQVGVCQLIGNRPADERVGLARSYCALQTDRSFGCTLGEAKEPTKEDA